MPDPQTTMALAALAGVLIVTAALLRAWTGWLQLKQRELDRTAGGDQPPAGTTAARIELADLKERVRRLEAIASGVDL